MNYITDLVVTQESIYESLGSSVELVCPIINTTRAIIWLGPPNLRVYAVGKHVPTDLSSQVDISETDTNKRSILLIQHFNIDKSGKFMCSDSFYTREFDLIIKSKIKTKSPMIYQIFIYYFNKH